MSKSITVAMLVAKAIELNPALTEETAKLLIKSAGAKSYKRVEEAVNAAKVEKKTTRKAKGEVTMVEPGPRGFRFGSTYIQSVIDGGPIALKEANKLKLIAFAETIGVAGINLKSDIEEAVKSMKTAAKKYMSQNFEVAA